MHIVENFSWPMITNGENKMFMAVAVYAIKVAEQNDDKSRALSYT